MKIGDKNSLQICDTHQFERCLK